MCGRLWFCRATLLIKGFGFICFTVRTVFAAVNWKIPHPTPLRQEFQFVFCFFWIKRVLVLFFRLFFIFYFFSGRRVLNPRSGRFFVPTQIPFFFSGFSPVWVRWCTLKLPACVNRLSQILHTNGFSPVSLCWCLVKLLNAVYRLSQILFTNGFALLHIFVTLTTENKEWSDNMERIPMFFFLSCDLVVFAVPVVLQNGRTVWFC